MACMNCNSNNVHEEYDGRTGQNRTMVCDDCGFSQSTFDHLASSEGYPANERDFEDWAHSHGYDYDERDRSIREHDYSR